MMGELAVGAVDFDSDPHHSIKAARPVPDPTT